MCPDAIALTDHDLRQLADAGIPPDEAARQLALLAKGRAWVRLDRPCVAGDGIERLEPEDEADALAAHAEAAAAGRVRLFVPASGAATRMFRELLQVLEQRHPRDPAGLEHDLAEGRPEARALQVFLEGMPRFAFRAALADALATAGHNLARLVREGPWLPILEALLGSSGLGCGERPKGVLPFHVVNKEPRTPVEEHLVEAAVVVRDRDGCCRVHFTVSPAHRPLFENLLDRARPRWESRLRARLEVSLSTQKPSTDTLAYDAQGRPSRGPEGALLLRPAGHGALIENLKDLGGDIAFLKNVDNVAHEHLKAPGLHWARVLIGRLAGIEARAHELLHRLEAGADVADEALAFAKERLQRTPVTAAADREAKRSLAIALLDRPLRVCGMVPNTGEPGGGPYWAVGRDGVVTRQIVESAQVDHGEPAQHAIFEAGTHFNPVFMACGLRDHRARPYDLDRFVDPEAIILTRKSSGGSELLALERPGLWNGAMAGWNSCFVEVPLGVFNPVKTVLDLLRPAHQPG